MWVEVRVEVATSDARPDTPARIVEEVRRALDARFGACIVELAHTEPALVL